MFDDYCFGEYFERMLDELRNLFNDVTDGLKELRDFVWYDDERSLKPRAYGQSLHKCGYLMPRYAYVRSFQRGLPYHRRQH